MIDPRDIVNLVNPHVERILTIAEAAFPRCQFIAYRKLVLDEFGWNGLRSELQTLIDERRDKRNG